MWPNLGAISLTNLRDLYTPTVSLFQSLAAVDLFDLSGEKQDVKRSVICGFYFDFILHECLLTPNGLGHHPSSVNSQ